MSLKDKLRNNELTIGSWITLGHSAIAEIMAKAGFDWLTIDLEHSVITIKEAEDLIRTIDLCGVSPLVRLTSNDEDQIKRVMDAGSHGIIVPNIKSSKEAEKAVASVKYPPVGKRGVGLARAQQYGNNFEGHWKWLEDESVVIVQIEHIDAVNDLEAILSTEGVDGYIMGPFDLTASMGIPGQFEHPDFIAAMEKVKSVAKKLNKTGGIHIIKPNKDELNQRIDEGYKFLAYSLDTIMIDTSCRLGLGK